jgi:UDP-glucose 4-epimerase
MSVKSFAAKIFAAYVQRQINSWASKPVETQKRVFEHLLKTASKTEFGKTTVLRIFRVTGNMPQGCR